MNDWIIYTNSELLLHNPTRWNREVIEIAFNPHEANIVQQIPLAQENIPDTIAWNFDLKGNYSVKSGYRTPEIGKSRAQSSILYIIAIQEGLEIHLEDEDPTKTKVFT